MGAGGGVRQQQQSVSRTVSLNVSQSSPTAGTKLRAHGNRKRSTPPRTKHSQLGAGGHARRAVAALCNFCRQAGAGSQAGQGACHMRAVPVVVPRVGKGAVVAATGGLVQDL